MIGIDFVNIDNAKVIGRLLPYWVRGKKMSLLLQALVYPLSTAHIGFKAWALERYIESHITAQRSSLEWYLKYKLSKHFKNESDTFSIDDNNENSTVITAPAIIETTNYDAEDYQRDIRYILSRYMINFNKIQINITEL